MLWQGTRDQWQVVFLICTMFYIIGAIFYLILASGEEQPWSFIQDSDGAKHETIRAKKLSSIAPYNDVDASRGKSLPDDVKTLPEKTSPLWWYENY